MGIRPPENFNKPFLSKNVSEFWLRMHRSLTLWLTDYVFSPTYKRALSSRILSAHPVTAMSYALLVTMIVSGLWHGTTASFLVFGIVHGIYLVIQRVWEAAISARLGRKKARELRQRLFYRFSSTLLTFHATAFAYVFFVLDLNRIVTMFKYMEFRIG
jgi:D-alanyl-lipoteichoic acid acyltransferase DltB (MBOAT superfamily)